MPFVKKPGFQRFSVERDSTEWVGYDFLTNLVQLCNAGDITRFLRTVGSSVPEAQALVACAQETGLRISEILPYVFDENANDYIYGLRSEQFHEELDPNCIIIIGARVLKQFTVSKDAYVQKWRCKHCTMRWETEPTLEMKIKHANMVEPYLGLITQRKVEVRDIPIGRKVSKDGQEIDNPLLPYIMSWQKVKKGILFEKWNPHYFWRLCRLFSGRTGVRISPHWFRAQKARYLGTERGLSPFEIKEFFGWSDIAMAERYSSRFPKWRGLTKRLVY